MLLFISILSLVFIQISFQNPNRRKDLTSTVTPYTYDESFARGTMMAMSAAAYSAYPEKCVSTIGGTTENYEFINSYLVECDSGDLFKANCSAFIAVFHELSAILIAYRGSENFKQIVDEFQSHALVPMFQNQKFLVNEYFLSGFNLLWDSTKTRMKDDLFSAINKYPTYNLWISGHSLGGAMASIASFYFKYMGYFNNPIILYTFGQPRTGDQNYAAMHEFLVPRTFRVVHSRDPVPHVPFEKSGYFHHGIEVWYPTDMFENSLYKVCPMDEDPSCMDSVASIIDILKIAEHTHYFELDIQVEARPSDIKLLKRKTCFRLKNLESGSPTAKVWNFIDCDNDKPPCPEGYTRASFNCNCYKVYTPVEPMTFADAQALCEIDGGNLVSIHSEAENGVVALVTKEAGVSFGWIGFVDTSNGYTWNDGSKFDYGAGNWFPIYNDTTPNPYNLSCAYMHADYLCANNGCGQTCTCPHGDWFGKWTPRDCNHKQFNAICKL